MQADQGSKTTRTNIRIGLIGGIGAILVILLLNMSGAATLMDYGLTSLIIPCMAAIIATVIQKKSQSSYLNFGQGMSTSIVVFGIGNLVNSIFLILLETVFEPSLPSRFINIKKERLNQQLITKAVDKAGFNREMEAFNQFHGSSEILKSSLLSFFLFTIFAIIIFIISSSIIKDEQLKKN